MTPEQWLSAQIKEKGIKQTFIAEKTGIPERTLSATLTGRRHIKAEELIGVCIVTGINPLDYPAGKAGEANA